MNISIVNETPGYVMLAWQIDNAFSVSRSLVSAIADEAGLRLFLEIERKIDDCLNELGIPLRKYYLNTDSHERIMEQVAMRIDFVLGACNDLRIYDPARADKVLADLAAAACDVQVKLHLLSDSEWAGLEGWGN